MSGAELVLLAGLAVAGASTGVALATRPSLPGIPKPRALPPVPPPALPPPEAPQPEEAEEGVARGRRRRARGFGLEQTILAPTSALGSGTPSLLSQSSPGRGTGRGSQLGRVG